MLQQQDFYQSQESDYYHQDAMTVAQHLTTEQYLYEFPTKDCLEALAYLDDANQNSFFDASSFTSTAFSSAYYYDSSSFDHETIQEEDELVDDGRLSPLQLPSQVSPRPRPLSCDTVIPVGPASFLADTPLCDHVTPKDECLDNASVSSSIPSDSRIVIIKLNRLHKQSPITYIQPKFPEGSYSDEGYDDTTELDEELESQCIFYPLNEDEESSEKDRAATKIQAVWRGYASRKQAKTCALKPDQQVMLGLAKISNRFHQRQMQAMQDRLNQLEQRVRQESAMRRAFEKAMEDMTVVMDQQQKVLYDRLEQEVHLRQAYETKMNATLAQLQPLETRLRKETSSRLKLEEMMTRVLDQMHASETARQKQVEQEAASRRQLQAQLDKALEGIEELKSRKDTNVRRSMIPNTTKQVRSSTPLERPSVVPSIRRTQKSTLTNRNK
ncbi:uncharacterized protein B0P05DRAFT_291618 [Gilbertella persicaria]|uniref:uncharacterized protein n=1 Tax=Gilbertella persicaria TaxID=101096 RepID=UPI00221E4A88|nr:uncharacterized protein B0P05DRAFT_291618 [Gilbertella persicaria]KAI8054980.1 hypothetical protein B0P05DRAFT_291618 [Gilbertella persicaria]